MTADAFTPPPGPPAAGTEAQALLGALERNRRTFAWKCADLDAAGLSATTAASTMTLGGLLKHLALVEDHYFTAVLLGEPMPQPWRDAYDHDDPDWEWHTAADDAPASLYAWWEAAVARSRDAVARAMAADGLDQLVAPVDGEGERRNLRRVVVDLIEEYARHTGHADVLREAVDGRVGEDAPS